jgi:hypothetical protein
VHAPADALALRRRLVPESLNPSERPAAVRACAVFARQMAGDFCRPARLAWRQILPSDQLIPSNVSAPEFGDRSV